jgi:hypothetical protein
MISNCLGRLSSPRGKTTYLSSENTSNCLAVVWGVETSMFPPTPLWQKYASSIWNIVENTIASLQLQRFVLYLWRFKHVVFMPPIDPWMIRRKPQTNLGPQTELARFVLDLLDPIFQFSQVSQFSNSDFCFGGVGGGWVGGDVWGLGGFFCFIIQDARNSFWLAFLGSSPQWVQVPAETKPCHGYP